ncbi:ribosome silencing factor [Anaerolineales bacterium]
MLDLRPDAIIADFFVLCNGDNERHLKALAENLREVIKTEEKRTPFANEGSASSGWLVLDYADVVVHIFSEEKRDFYRLEELWGEQANANVLLSIQ